MYKKIVLVLMIALFCATLAIGVYAESTATGNVGIDFVAGSGGKDKDGNSSGGTDKIDVYSPYSQSERVTIIGPKVPVEEVLGTLPKTGGNYFVASALLLTGILFISLDLRRQR